MQLMQPFKRRLCAPALVLTRDYRICAADISERRCVYCVTYVTYAGIYAAFMRARMGAVGLSDRSCPRRAPRAPANTPHLCVVYAGILTRDHRICAADPSDRRCVYYVTYAAIQAAFVRARIGTHARLSDFCG